MLVILKDVTRVYIYFVRCVGFSWFLCSSVLHCLPRIS